jgi:hypothetical protein
MVFITRLTNKPRPNIPRTPATLPPPYICAKRGLGKLSAWYPLQDTSTGTGQSGTRVLPTSSLNRPHSEAMD